MGLGTDIIYTVALTLSSPIWGLRLLKTGKWRTDWRGRFGHLAPLPSAAEQKTLLVHAVSVGEVNAIRLLIDQLRPRNAPNGRQLRIVISVTTDTGVARARELFGQRHTVVRFPFDFSRCVGRFLDVVRPDAVALVELEVWPNFTAACADRGIPAAIINGRLSARSYANYWRFRWLVRPMFRRIAAAGVQSREYARRFEALGIPGERVRVLDTMKWDTAQVADPVSFPGADALAAALGLDRSRPIIVAGSTGPGEEKLLLDGFARHPQVQLVLVPRKPERFDEAAALCPAIVRRTQCPDGRSPPAGPRQFFLLDTMGELRKAYALADVCIVGRSFLGLYGSDMMEPIALGKPTIIGPHHSDFADMVRAFAEAEGIVITADPVSEALALLEDRPRAARLAENGRRVILSHQGATARHAEMLAEILEAKQIPKDQEDRSSRPVGTPRK